MVAASNVSSRRAGFTLVEMLLVLGIIALLAGFVLAAMAGAREAAQVTATRSLITRLHSRLMAKWDSYRFRRLPVDLNMAAIQRDPSLNYATAKTLPPATKQALRMEVIWELQRFELPDKWTDIDPHSISGISGMLSGLAAPPATYRPLIFNSSGTLQPTGALANYRRIFKANVVRLGTFDLREDQYQSAECLYLIMTSGLGEDSLSPEELAGNAVGDKDNDGFREFHDAWGEPIDFMRWPCGLVSDLQPVQVTSGGVQYRDPGSDPDPLDYTKVFQKARATSDPPYSDPFYGYRLVPLIESSGPDKVSDRESPRGRMLVAVDASNWWSPLSFALRFGGSTYDVERVRCPYVLDPGNQGAGRPFAASDGWADNINNHQSGAK